MGGRLLLDTSVIVDLFTDGSAVQHLLAAADEVFVPAIALGELFYGAQRSNRREANLAQVEAFASAAAVLPCDLQTARHYGEIRDALRARGRPLPENDIWIASLARQYALTVATRDSHFREIDGLALVAW
ncbi:MAG TPA: type II toxin-antitoxin system VapC family toxin [Longimicrobiaceae bacterium]|nr:type II toxin-antitoxin system VapC family toxin [Longimicrobiaceae bacterium]